MPLRRPVALILVAEGFDEIECFVPFYRFLEIGWHSQIVSPQILEAIRGRYGMHFSEFKKIDEFQWNQSDILIIPGGRSPRYIVTRHLEGVRPVVNHFLETGKPIGVMSQGLLVLAMIEHLALSHVEVASVEGIADEVRPRVGGLLERGCVISGNIVTSRCVHDLPDFLRGLFHVLFERDRARVLGRPEGVSGH